MPTIPAAASASSLPWNTSCPSRTRRGGRRAAISALPMSGTANQTFQLWTLHAWVYEYNPDGVFAAFNPRVP